MSHFLGGKIRRFPTIWLGKVYAGVKVRLLRARPPVLEVQPGVMVLCGVELFRLPPEVLVVGPSGEPLRSTGIFLISPESS